MACDKSKLPPGPWQDEPDEEDFIHAGYYCVIRRNSSGCLCGYVMVPEGHPLYGKKAEDRVPWDRDSVPWRGVTGGIIDLVLEASVGDPKSVSVTCLLQPHGGVTLTCGDQMLRPEDKSLWVFGFDCGHAWDVTPALLSLYEDIGVGPFSERDQTYRDIYYVREEVRQMADRLRTVAEVFEDGKIAP